MTAHKHIDSIALVVIGLALLFCILAIALAPKLNDTLGGSGVTMEYEERLFNTDEIITVDIQISEEEWQNILDNPTAEEYHTCDVVINGTRFSSVAIRTKGNTSLTTIAMDPNNQRYSFKIEFDRNIEGQTCWGLDKLVLNNNYADATNMKEALIYDMFAFLGADASLYNYAEISVNGEYWGVYLALEGVEDGFMLRNYGVQSGALYKPETMAMGGDADEDRDFPGFDFPDLSASGEAGAEAEETPAPKAETDSGDASGEASVSFEMPDFDFGGFSNGGANLNYTDDDLDSYSTIWAYAKTKTSDADHRRVVEALKHIDEGTELETYMDVDNLLRFMAVHNFSVNSDSLSGGMTHNYYLYESGGLLNMIPWDYNLSLGGMGMGGSDANGLVNDPIDDKWSATHFFDALLDNEEYLAKYHEYYRELVEEYIFGGGFDAFYERTRNQIDELVAADPNALYTYEEYDEAAQMLYKTVKLRGESILGQLDGTIPSTSSGQRADSSALIEASEIDLSVMGGMGIGGGFSFGSGEPSGEMTETSSREFSFPDFGDGLLFASDEPEQEDNTAVVWTLIACGVVFAVGMEAVVLIRKKG